MKPRLVDFRGATDLVTAAADTLFKWPREYHASLHKIAAAHTGDKYVGVGTVFGQMYRYLYKDLRSPHFNFLRQQFELYLSANWIGNLGTRKIPWFSKVTRESGRYVTRKVAGRALELSDAKILELVRSRQLPGVIHNRQCGRDYVLVDRAGLNEFKEHYKKPLCLRHASKLLGIPRQRVCELIEAGILEARKSYRNASGQWIISQPRLRDLILTITSGLSVVPKPCNRAEQITLAHLLKFYVTRDGAFASFFAALIDGKIKALGRARGIQGLPGLLFSRTAALGFILTHDTYADYLNMRSCSVQLGIWKGAINSLMNTGALKYRTIARGRRTMRVVSLPEIERFRRTYVTTSELARQHGVHYSQIVRCLKQAHIKPITGPSVDGTHTHVYTLRSVKKLFDSGTIAAKIAAQLA